MQNKTELITDAVPKNCSKKPVESYTEKTNKEKVHHQIL